MKVLKRFNILLFFTFFLFFCQTSIAQTIIVSPQPQKINWGKAKAFDNNASFKVKGLKTADTDATALLKKKINLDEKGITLIIGERGDKTVKKYSSLIPQQSEGYYISITPKEVVIAGNDERGTYYGVQTFLQIVSAAKVMCVTITDYPDVATRGMVEGFYGNP